MAEHINGLKDYGELISKEDEKLRNGKPLTDRNLPFLDFRQFPLAGAEALDDHTLRIRLDGKYPQFKYWLTMTSSRRCRGRPTSSMRSPAWPSATSA